jgi:transcriptional regulator with XRE-family HTH domain
MSGSELYRIRLALGISQQSLAAVLNLTAQDIAAAESSIAGEITNAAVNAVCVRTLGQHRRGN